MTTTAYACGSGGVMFVPEKIERTMPRVMMRRSNDNQTEDKKLDQNKEEDQE